MLLYLSDDLLADVLNEMFINGMFFISNPCLDRVFDGYCHCSESFLNIHIASKGFKNLGRR